VRPVYGERVRSTSPLLSDEKTASVLPALAMPVPERSAWLPVELRLPRYCDARGQLQLPALRRALHSCLGQSEVLAGACSWPLGRQAADQRDNNRLAMLVTGIGDLVLEHRMDPASIACLRWIEGLVRTLRDELRQCSRDLARESGPVPALAESDPAAAWPDPGHRENWRRRWREALESQAVRHRNLLVMSPYAVLPRGRKANAPYTDLLPVLALADAVSFRHPPGFDGWNIKEFSHFHRRAWAVLHRETVD
ncbi:MAG: hypothetical protein ACREQZ_00875, partial [Woeseiaceae bacterium]